MKNNQPTMGMDTILILVLIGLFAGMLSGMVGIGGGIIIVPALIFFLGFTQHQAQGTSLGLLLLPVGILAVTNYYQKGFVDIKVVAVMSIAFIMGGWLGSKLSLALPGDLVKKIFAIVLFYTGIKMMGWDALFVKWFKNIFA